MKLENHYILDYQMLLSNPEVLLNSKDSLFTVPLSNLDIINELIREILDDNYTDVETKDFIKNIYLPLLDMIYIKTEILSQITEEKKFQSDAICVNAMESVFLNLSGSCANKEIFLSEETLNDLDLIDYDVINACIMLNTPLLSQNKELLDIINKENLDIEVISHFDNIY